MRRDILLAAIIALSVAAALFMDAGLERRAHQDLPRADSADEITSLTKP